MNTNFTKFIVSILLAYLALSTSCDSNTDELFPLGAHTPTSTYHINSNEFAKGEILEILIDDFHILFEGEKFYPEKYIVTIDYYEIPYTQSGNSIYVSLDELPYGNYSISLSGVYNIDGYLPETEISPYKYEISYSEKKTIGNHITNISITTNEQEYFQYGDSFSLSINYFSLTTSDSTYQPDKYILELGGKEMEFSTSIVNDKTILTTTLGSDIPHGFIYGKLHAVFNINGYEPITETVSLNSIFIFHKKPIFELCTPSITTQTTYNNSIIDIQYRTHYSPNEGLITSDTLKLGEPTFNTEANPLKFYDLFFSLQTNVGFDEIGFIEPKYIFNGVTWQKEYNLIDSKLTGDTTPDLMRIFIDKNTQEYNTLEIIFDVVGTHEGIEISVQKKYVITIIIPNEYIPNDPPTIVS